MVTGRFPEHAPVPSWAECKTNSLEALEINKLFSFDGENFIELSNVHFRLTQAVFKLVKLKQKTVIKRFLSSVELQMADV